MFFRQLYLLLWKNLIIRVRHFVRTIIEIIWPILLFSILIAVRLTVPPESLAECHYPARALPSAGIFPWIQTMFCNIDNPCFNVPVASETPGQINDPLNGTTGLTGGFRNILETIDETLLQNTDAFVQDITILRVMINEIAKPDSSVKATISSLMGDSSATKAALASIGLSTELADTILQSQVTLYQVTQLNSYTEKKLLVCDPTLLNMTATIPPSAPLNVTQASNELCALSDVQLNSVWSELQNGVDLQAFFDSEGNDLLIEAGTKSGLNTADLTIFVLLRLPELNRQLQTVLGVVTDLVSQFAPTGNGNVDFITAVIGYNLSSTQGFQEFCGHPAPRSQFGQQALLGITNVVVKLGGNSSSNTEFCTNLINAFETNENLTFAWSMLKPILFGKIPYSPDTNVTRDIITRANATFSAVADIEGFARSWLKTTGPTIYDFLESDQNLALLRTVLASNLSSTGIIDISESQLKLVRAFLSNEENATRPGTITWKQLYSQINVGVVLIQRMLSCINLNKFEGYPNEAALVERSLDLLSFNTYWAGIVFLSPTADDTELPKHIKYKIRQDVDDVMRTDFIKMYFWQPGPLNGPEYIRYLINGFADMQDMMEQGITKSASEAYINSSTISVEYSGQIPKLGYYLQQIPYPCYTSDLFLTYLSNMMSLLMTLAWIYSVCIIIKNIVYEKEERLKEFMKMMGLSNGVHWVAWFINSFYLMFISSVLLIAVLRAGLILPYSNPFLILLWLLSFCIATIAECFLISCFFSKANLAAACGGIIYFLLYIPYNFAVTWEDELSYGGKIGLSLFATVSFGYGAGFVSKYEMSGEGLQFSNWNTNPVPGEQYTFLVSLIMMLVDAVIYFILTWYVENVYPGKYGIPRPPYFPFTASYWCGTPSKPSHVSTGIDNPSLSKPGQISMETEPLHLPLGVSIENLTKIYSNGNKLAVDNLTLNFYEGQITSFLGHNGAGKTTTMSILCGLFTPTQGTAYIHGNDIRMDMDTIRKSLGMCPQHNVLFRDLTVEEHLNFYAGLRGASQEAIRTGTEKMLMDVNLVHKRSEVVHNLSGGMKRKLSVAVAFTGDSKTVILDEPTAGVDPYARRGIWDLLVKYREGRTIVLSTHHMDEADLLGDRIAIISQGHLKCCGSSLFLKSTYGVGYYLTLVKQKTTAPVQCNERAVLDVSVKGEFDNTSDDEGFVSKAASSKSSISGEKISILEKESHLTKREAEDLICSIVPNAKVYEENIGEITFILPYDGIQEGKYAGLFQLLDNHNISYGLTDTSLEEIFLSVADHVDEAEKPDQSCCSCLPRKRRHSVSSVAPYSPEAKRKNEPVQLLKVSSNQHSTDSVSLHEDGRDGPNGETTVPHKTIIQLETLPEVTEEEQEEEDNVVHNNGKGSYKLTGEKLIAQQFMALLIKRLHHARRNRKGIFAQIILPSGFVLVALCFTLILPPYDGQPSLELQPWMYGDYLNTFYSNDNPSSTASNSVSDALISSPGFGTRCVDGYTIDNFGDAYLNCVPTTDNEWRTNNLTESLSQEINSVNRENCTCTGNNDRILLSECPNGAGGSPTPYLHANNTDTLYNMTGRDVADWLVKTTDRFIEKRYGGLSVGEVYHSSFDENRIDKLLDLLQKLNVTTPDKDNVTMLLESLWRTENAKVWFDNNGFHAMPSYLNVLSNGILRSKLPADADSSEYALTLYNHPMNYTKEQVSQAALAQTAIDTAIAIVVVFAMSFVPASFVIFLIDERVTKAKHLQFISGVNQSIYWIANYVWDMINYLIPAIIVIIIFICFQTDAYVSSQNLPCLICLLILYGWSITPMMYPFSFVFEVPSTAYVVLTCINLFIGINTSIATLILELLQDNEHLQYVNGILQSVFLIFPHFCLGRGLIDMAINQATADAYARFGVDSFVEPLNWDLAGKNLVAMAIEGFVFFGINLLIQYRFFIQHRINDLPPPLVIEESIEDDVLAEKTRIEKQNDSDDILRVKHLSKVYRKMPLGKSVLAVDRMTVGVSGGECFGLLGVNGAGKTTTFKMLTGDISPTAGDATICGTSINEDIRSVQQNSGYCPQFDALNSQLTGFEHLQLYARLRGVPKDEIDDVASWGIAKLGLKQYADKPAGTYSGGNKRKLSAAIAFIGCPPIIFLDEPTAGMDPGARRFLWRRILEVIKDGEHNTDTRERCIVLTSHSMEECEALCTRLAIMVNGQFKCIGTPQHLKNKYGKGYTLSVRVGGVDPDLNKVQDFLLKAFPGAVLKERHHNMIVLQLPLEFTRLAEVFKCIEVNKLAFQIEDYSISQTTLDEVFVNFAKHQTDGLQDKQQTVVTSSAAQYEMKQVSSMQPVVA